MSQKGSNGFGRGGHGLLKDTDTFLAFLRNDTKHLSGQLVTLPVFEFDTS